MIRTHLVLALGGFSWGETSFGVRLARELHQRGDRIQFVVHGAFRRLLLGLEFPVEFVSCDPDLHRVVANALDPASGLSSIILADGSIATEVLEAAGIEPGVLLSSAAPVIAIDTWDYAATGDTIDLAFGRTRAVKGAIDEAAVRILPVPLLRPEGAAMRCNALPPGIHVAADDRRRLRDSIGLSDGDRAILVCTAPWQVERGASDAAVPALISACLSQLGENVHVVHVGPSASALGRYLGDRYHWQRSLTAARFDLLLGSVDLLLSLNVSATTIGKAVASRLPALVLQNSIETVTPDDTAAALGHGVPEPLKQWIDAASPIPRFRVWPLGFFDYLSPILAANPYQETFLTCELHDHHHLLDTCHRLLFDEASRDALRHRQDVYVTRVASLPTPAEAIGAALDCGLRSL